MQIATVIAVYANWGFARIQGININEDKHCREIMHAMWQPRKFKSIYFLATLYVFTLTIPSAVAVYWSFGDQLLDHSNAFSLLPKNVFRDAAVILMLIHQVKPKSNLSFCCALFIKIIKYN